jgi:pimeloyl-ACP methyl ester carboxylesterase
MASFSQPAKALSGKHQVIRMEHLNVQYAKEGLSLPANYSLATESEAIGYTLDSLKIEGPVVLVGWSYGALIALDFALNHPSRVRKLILYEPPAFWVATAKGESPAGMQQMLQLLQSFTPNATITQAQYAQFRCILEGCDPLVITTHPQWSTWVKQKDRLRGLSAVATHSDSLKRLQSFRQPVLILTGAGTVAYHQRINQLLAVELPGAKSKDIPGGHTAPQAAVDEFIQTIVEFVE